MAIQDYLASTKNNNNTMMQDVDLEAAATNELAEAQSNASRKSNRRSNFGLVAVLLIVAIAAVGIATGVTIKDGTNNGNAQEDTVEPTAPLANVAQIQDNTDCTDSAFSILNLCMNEVEDRFQISDEFLSLVEAAEFKDIPQQCAKSFTLANAPSRKISLHRGARSTCRRLYSCILEEVCGITEEDNEAADELEPTLYNPSEISTGSSNKKPFLINGGFDRDSDDEEVDLVVPFNPSDDKGDIDIDEDGMIDIDSLDELGIEKIDEDEDQEEDIEDIDDGDMIDIDSLEEVGVEIVDKDEDSDELDDDLFNSDPVDSLQEDDDDFFDSIDEEDELIRANPLQEEDYDEEDDEESLLEFEDPETEPMDIIDDEDAEDEDDFFFEEDLLDEYDEDEDDDETFGMNVEWNREAESDGDDAGWVPLDDEEDEWGN